MKVLINCSNLHGGGSAAVAASFVYQLSKDFPTDLRVSLLVSSYVLDDLHALRVSLDKFEKVEVVNYRGIEALWKGLKSKLKKYDVVFTVFGPAYIFGGYKGRHIVGFAQPSIVYPERISLFERSLVKRLKLRLKYCLQSFFFCKSDLLVVELEHVKKALNRKLGFSRKDISIVKSTFDEIYMEPERWKSIAKLEGGGGLKLGLISRNYPHKNIEILARVKEILLVEYSLSVDFYVTFSEQEWEECSSHLKSAVTNVGRLELAQCPSFYSQLDGVVFPSLLECFSAVPLEAMVLEKPLFASDLEFIRDCCREYAYYFDPLSPESIAESVIKGVAEATVDLKKAKAHALSFGGAGRRAKEYLSLIKSGGGCNDV